MKCQYSFGLKHSVSGWGQPVPDERILVVEGKTGDEGKPGQEAAGPNDQLEKLQKPGMDAYTKEARDAQVCLSSCVARVPAKTAKIVFR